MDSKALSTVSSGTLLVAVAYIAWSLFSTSNFSATLRCARRPSYSTFSTNNTHVSLSFVSFTTLSKRLFFLFHWLVVCQHTTIPQRLSESLANASACPQCDDIWYQATTSCAHYLLMLDFALRSLCCVKGIALSAESHDVVRSLNCGARRSPVRPRVGSNRVARPVVHPHEGRRDISRTCGSWFTSSKRGTCRNQLQPFTRVISPVLAFRYGRRLSHS